MSETAIKIEHLSKMYRLGVINSGTLRKDIQSWFALKLGKEDPNSKIGENKYKGDADHFWALKDVNFEIKQGDRVGIIGKNGAGKSTLLKILSRITAPTEGVIKIKGKIASLLEVGTGFHAELTGRENIYLNGAILGMKKRRIDEKIDEIITFSGIEHHIDTPVKRYSSGMYVRLAFAVAAHLDSDILIADEVLAVGDAEFQKKALGKMQDLSTGEGRTVLFVSHNMGAVKKLCNVGVVLDKGKMEFIGGINECINYYSSMITPQAPLEISSEKIFDIDESKPCQLEKIEILDKNNKQKSVYEAHEEIIFRLYYISRSPIPNMYGWFCIKTDDGTPVILFDSRENGDDTFNNIKNGKYIFNIKIPAGILPFGEYTLNLCLGSGDYKDFYIDFNEMCLRFKVQDSLTIRGNNRNALTSLILPWELVQINPLL